MSYSFGGGITDGLITWLAAEVPTTLSTYLAWVKFLGNGGNGFGRLLVLNSGQSTVQNNETTTPNTFTFSAFWSPSTLAVWEFPRVPLEDVWHHLAIVYDGGSTANDPVIYIDGVSQAGSITETTSPAGTNLSAGSDIWYLGNRAGGDRSWDGKIAEVARVNRLLSAGEVTDQAGGDSAAFLSLSGADRYVKLFNTIVDEVSSEVGSLSGTGAVQDNDHPTISYPSGGAPVRRYGTLLGVG